MFCGNTREIAKERVTTQLGPTTGDWFQASA